MATSQQLWQAMSLSLSRSLFNTTLAILPYLGIAVQWDMVTSNLPAFSPCGPECKHRNT